MKRRKKTKRQKAEEAAIERLWPFLRPIFLDENGVVRPPDDYQDTRRHRPQRAGQ